MASMTTGAPATKVAVVAGNAEYAFNAEVKKQPRGRSPRQSLATSRPPPSPIALTLKDGRPIIRRDQGGRAWRDSRCGDAWWSRGWG